MLNRFFKVVFYVFECVMNLVYVASLDELNFNFRVGNNIFIL